MKNPIKQKHILTLTLLILVFLLTACSNNDNEDFASNDANRTTVEITGGIDNTIIENYIYLQETNRLPHITGFIHNVIIHNGQIYISYINESTIIIESISPDGTQISRTEIPTSFDHGIHISALQRTAENNFALIFTGWEYTEYGINATIMYAEYTRQGTEITSRNLTEILAQENPVSRAEQALFTYNDDIILLTPTSQIGLSIIYLIDNQFNVRGQMEVEAFQPIIQMSDGRLFINDSLSLHEIDFEQSELGESYPLPVTNARSLYPARDIDPFDLYINDGTHLFGYDIETGDKTMLLNWVESGIEFGFSPHLNILEDGRISLITDHGDFIILTRTSRAELPEYTVITVGVLFVPDITPLRNQASAFNRENRYYQIQIVEYWDDYWENRESAEMRFSIDLMTGHAPDIIIVPQHMREAIIRQGLIIDLFPFIDADPEINRSDFLPNILGALETPDGTLPIISEHFSVSTIIGMADVVGDIESWTLTEMLALMERSDTEFILGEWVTADLFLDWVLEFSEQDFINWAEHTANLDSEEFIQLLEIANRLPHEFTFEFGVGIEISPLTRMLRQEQLLTWTTFHFPANYQLHTGILGDDIVALGMPTESGGVHLINVSDGLAISTTSPHQDAAWSFIRQFLLQYTYRPAQYLWSNFPIRHDSFENLITEAMTPWGFEIDEDGNEVEMSRGGSISQDITFSYFAMTETEEQGLRNIIESASVLGHFDETISNMVREETLPFFAGTRSAADTARILQNRISIYLSELS